MELRLSRHQSLTVSFAVFGPTAKCVKSPSWMTKAGFSEAPAAYAGAGLGVSWSANATNVNDALVGLGGEGREAEDARVEHVVDLDGERVPRLREQPRERDMGCVVVGGLRHDRRGRGIENAGSVVNDDGCGLRRPHDQNGGRVGDAADQRGLGESCPLVGHDVRACARGRGEAETRREDEAPETDLPCHAQMAHAPQPELLPRRTIRGLADNVSRGRAGDPAAFGSRRARGRSRAR